MEFQYEYGENGHVEYGWSSDMEERIVQFSFQLTRTTEERIQDLSLILDKMLSELKSKLYEDDITKEVAKGYLSILYKLIGYTRDIIHGKGEYALSYMMIHTWHAHFPELSYFAIQCMVSLDSDDHPYGSWKDIKLLCEYCKKKDNTTKSPLIQYAVSLLNKQIQLDYTNFICNEDDLSLAAKWAPREKSAHGWLFEMLAKNYFPYLLQTTTDHNNYRRALMKCKMEYRKILASLNRKIETLQIKQCENNWSSINFDRVPSIAMLKQRKSFLNIKANGETRCPDNQDRIDCATHFTDFVQNRHKEIQGKRISMVDFTKQALEILRTENPVERDMLNSQWRDSSSMSPKLGKMVAMVDVSGSMNGNPLYAAIALGIRIAETSVIGNRVMTFHSKPTWVNLDKAPDFVSKVDMIQNAEWGANTNFYAALNMILDAIVETKMTPEDVQDMVLVVLSDMQMDVGDNNYNKKALYEVVQQKYADTGKRLYGVPFKPPHILFWNLRSTNGFPCLSKQANVTMTSGFSPMMLQMFCEEGMTSLQSCTPWSTLNTNLKHPRYQTMNNKLYEILQHY